MTTQTQSNCRDDGEARRPRVRPAHRLRFAGEEQQLDLARSGPDDRAFHVHAAERLSGLLGMERQAVRRAGGRQTHQARGRGGPYPAEFHL